ncbi:hypothetical protein [uncultured Megasphaera sp.]|uniref:hypothetical protein n=1 Tax=uncultured Megasphaera sp. TaxID=165188 RepID=UPI0025D0D2FE|nr:hypothetical protein [uncultured Megasphaera sp.]
MTQKELYDQIDALSDELTNIRLDGDSAVILLADIDGFARTGSINGPTLPTIVKLLEMMDMLMDGCSYKEKRGLKNLIIASVVEM